MRSADVTAKIAEGVGPTDRMHGHRGGCEVLAHFAQAYARKYPLHVIAKTDVANAFGSVHRADIIAAATVYPSLVPLARMLYGTSNQVIYSDEHSTLTLRVSAGVTQGEPLASLLYSTALRRAIDATLIPCIRQSLSAALQTIASSADRSPTSLQHLPRTPPSWPKVDKPCRSRKRSFTLLLANPPLSPNVLPMDMPQHRASS